MLRVLADNPVVDALGDAGAAGLVIALYAGLTALYRTSRTAAIVVAASLCVIVALGAWTVVMRRRGPESTLARAVRATAVGVAVLVATGIAVLLPIVAVDAVVDAVTG